MSASGREKIVTVRRGNLPIRVAILLAAPALVLVLIGFSRLAHTPSVAPQWVAVSGPQTVVYALLRAPWGSLFAATDKGVYTSSDRGTTWRRTAHTFPGNAPAAWALTVVHGTSGDADAVLAATVTGVVYSFSRAASDWTPGGRPATATYALFGLPQPGAVLAGTAAGIARSTDGGLTWHTVARMPGGEVVAFARDAADGTLYAGVAGLPHAALQVSHDDGRTWRLPTTTMPPRNVVALLATPHGIYAGLMGASPGQAVWVGGKGGFAVASTGLPQNTHGMSLALAGDRLLVGTMGLGTYSGTGRGPWIPLGHAPGDGIVTALLVLPGRPSLVLAGTDRGIDRLQLP